MSAAPGGSGSDGGKASAGHKMKYKNASLDSQELRRRREEEGFVSEVMVLALASMTFLDQYSLYLFPPSIEE